MPYTLLSTETTIALVLAAVVILFGFLLYFVKRYRRTIRQLCRHEEVLKIYFNRVPYFTDWWIVEKNFHQET